MLTIGEFSRLCRVSPRMLRHYDALGLLRPREVGENGYRYYAQAQLSDWVRIERLKDYGFPLGAIPALLELDEAGLLEKLRLQRDTLRQKLAQQRQQLRRLETDISHMEGTKIMENQYHAILMEDPALTVFSVRKTIGTAQYHELFEELRKEAAKRGLKQMGLVQMLYHSQEFDPNSSDVEAQMVVTEGPNTTVKPAYTCVAVEHKGSYEGLRLAYEALCGWLALHPEYRVCGPAMERYLNDPHQVASEDELRTGVMFPVEKV